MRLPLDIRAARPWLVIGVPLCAGGIVAGGGNRTVVAATAAMAAWFVVMLYEPLYRHHRRGPGSPILGRLIGVVESVSMGSALLSGLALHSTVAVTAIGAGAVVGSAAVHEAIRRRTVAEFAPAQAEAPREPLRLGARRAGVYFAVAPPVDAPAHEEPRAVLAIRALTAATLVAFCAFMVAAGLGAPGLGAVIAVATFALLVLAWWLGRRRLASG